MVISGRWVALVACVVLSGFALRPAVTSVGALLPELRARLPLDGASAGLLTALPTLCFALFGLAAVRVARRFGPEVAVCGAFGVVGIGLVARAVASGPAGFLAWTGVALAGTAAANVLGPPLVRRWFPRSAGWATGFYAMAIAAGVAAPAALSVPVADAAGPDGWRVGLAVWAPVAVLAALLWPVLARGRTPGAPVPDGPAEPNSDSGLGPDPGRGPGRFVVLMLTVLFGLQSLVAFVLMGWLPAILVDAGVGAGAAGVHLAATAALAVPLALAVPVLADRPRLRPALVAAISGATLAGAGGLMIAPGAQPWLWTVLLAAAHGAYPLAIALVRVWAGDPARELRLSGTVQTGGYCMAAAGPLAVGVLRDTTAGWTVPLTVVLALIVVQLLAGLAVTLPRAGSARHRSGGPPTPMAARRRAGRPGRAVARPSPARTGPPTRR